MMKEELYIVDKIIKNCEAITKMNQEAQNQKLRLFVKVDITTKLKILDQQKSIFHKLRGFYSDVDNVILTFSSLILATEEVLNKIDGVNLKALKLRSNNIKKQNLKREKLLSYWSIVRTLRLEQNMSFRNISNYLKKYHKFEVSYSIIYKTWIQIELKKEVIIGD